MSQRRVAEILGTLALLLAAWVFVSLPEEAPVALPPEEVVMVEEVGEDGTNATVTDVSDGDTFAVRFDTGEEARVRMLGVDTPETVDPRKPVQCFGKEASAFTKNLLSDARVRLEPDPMADERDRYGRLLRNVFTVDGTDVNAQLIREGFARAYLSFPLDPVRKKELTDLEAEAKAAARGLWGNLCNQ